MCSRFTHCAMESSSCLMYRQSIKSRTCSESISDVRKAGIRWNHRSASRTGRIVKWVWSMETIILQLMVHPLFSLLPAVSNWSTQSHASSFWALSPGRRESNDSGEQEGEGITSRGFASSSAADIFAEVPCCPFIFKTNMSQHYF